MQPLLFARAEAGPGPKGPLSEGRPFEIDADPTLRDDREQRNAARCGNADVQLAGKGARNCPLAVPVAPAGRAAAHEGDLVRRQVQHRAEQESERNSSGPVAGAPATGGRCVALAFLAVQQLEQARRTALS